MTAELDLTSVTRTKF